jgi:GTP pyrophosphokinase
MKIKEIIDAISQYHPLPDVSLIKRAYIYACYYHRDQKRLSGEPYIIHPIQVTKISKFNVNLNADERQIESLRKMFVFTAKDVRVILIKLADRLDNMRSIEFLPEESKKRMAEETLKIFAPIAHRLGLYKIKTELEDRAFEVLYPEAAEFVKKKIKKIKDEGEKIIAETEKKVAEILEKEGIENFRIESRIKGLYSIWEKMFNQGIDIENIYDIIGLRIIVPEVADCYRVLGILHTYFKPIPGKFKDYIAIPKPNGYKSLHTKVLLPGGAKVEFQVRTYQMHKEAEEGISAHWVYKEKAPISPSGMKIFSWLKSILEMSRETPEYEVKKISEDIYPDEIYVFTPKGDVKVLPRGATVIDFAYAVHSELGEKCVGAKVNGKLQPIDHILKSGDVVEIITSKNQKPKRSWLNFTVTQRAKARIKQYLNKEEKQIAKEIGLENLKRELRKFGLNLSEIMRAGLFQKIANSLNINDIEDFFIMLGSGKLSLNYVIKSLKKLLTTGEQTELQRIEPEKEKETKEKEERNKIQNQISNIKELQGNLKGVKIRFALCCTPVPGDDIVGYITRGYGIVLHRQDCQELEYLDKQRIVKINSEELPQDKYISKIKFIANSEEIISDIISKMRKEGFEISEVKIKEKEENKFEFELKLKVKDKSEVEKIMQEISAMKNIQNVGRDIKI